MVLGWFIFILFYVREQPINIISLVPLGELFMLCLIDLRKFIDLVEILNPPHQLARNNFVFVHDVLPLLLADGEALAGGEGMIYKIRSLIESTIISSYRIPILVSKDHGGDSVYLEADFILS